MNLPAILKLKPNKRTVIVAVVVVLVIEGLWAVKYLNLFQRFAPDTGAAPDQRPAQVQVNAVKSMTTFSLTTPKANLRKGENMTVNINIDSDKPTDGSDVILSYDPKVLMVVSEGPLDAPVKVGAIYEDYPVNAYDSAKGKITISGITTKSGGIVPKGLFGSIIFQAKAAGKTKISFDFNKGSTVDTNIIESKTARDILDEVRNLEVNISS